MTNDEPKYGQAYVDRLKRRIEALEDHLLYLQRLLHPSSQ